MKKFFSVFLIMFICLTCVFTGCSVTQINSDKYLDRVVATVDKDGENLVSITRRQLLNAYSTNGANYINQGFTAERTVKYLLDNLIDRELTIIKAKEYMGNIKDTDNNEYIDRYNEAVEDVFDFFDSTILSYENEIRTLKGLDKIKDTESEEKETTDPDYATFTKYEKKVLYFEDTNSYELVTYNSDEDKYERTYNYKVVESDGEYHRYFYNEQTKKFDIPASEYFNLKNITKTKLSDYNYLKNDHGDSVIRVQAYQRFINILIKNEEGKNLSTNENEVLQREFDRVIDTYLGNIYVQELENIYNINSGVDNSQILSLYKQKVADSYNKYAELDAVDSEDREGFTQYASDMNSGAKDVWYQPYGDQFVKVAHILIKLSDEDKTKLDNLDSDYKNNVITDYDSYLEQRNAILNNISTKPRYTYVDLANGLCEEEDVGNEYGTALTYAQIYDEVNKALTLCGNDVQKRAEKFNELIYKYGMDDGSFNQEAYYVVNMDTTIEDKMVKEFADKSRELIKQGAGSLGEPVLVEASNYVGYHIILAVEMTQNLVSIENLAEFGKGVNFDGAIKLLYDTRVMQGVDKSLYDVLYDSITKTSFSTYQTSVVDTYKDGAKINYLEKYYKDMY